MATEKDPNRS